MLALPQPSLAVAGGQLSAILKGIRSKYGHLPGLTVPYEREIITKSMALLGEPVKTDLATGHFFFKPPHYLKVQQETPRPETVIADGHTLWWYIPQKKQAYRYPSDKVGQELRLLSDIFLGLKKVEENFDVILEGDDSQERYRIKLNPNPPWPEIKVINLSVDKKDYAIRVVEIYNTFGGVTRFNLGDVSVQKEFEKDFFKFVVPEGVKVIEEN